MADEQSPRTTISTDERETIITWRATEKVAHIHAQHRGVWIKLERYGYKPSKVYCMEAGRPYAKDYEVPLAVISLRRGAKGAANLPPLTPDQGGTAPKRRGPLSAERKAAMAEGRRRAAEARRQTGTATG